LYVLDSLTVGDHVAAWARTKGKDRSYRIALCGLDGEYDLPEWTLQKWKTQGSGKNKDRERIWFSPGCLALKKEAA